jgi:hypothetical protein
MDGYAVGGPVMGNSVPMAWVRLTLSDFSAPGLSLGGPVMGNSVPMAWVGSGYLLRGSHLYLWDGIPAASPTLPHTADPVYAVPVEAWISQLRHTSPVGFGCTVL